MVSVVAEWNAVLKDTQEMNNDDDDDTRTNESTQGSIYNTFFGLCELAEKQMELSPFLFRKHFTNELSVSCVFLMKKKIPQYFKNLRPHISQLLSPPPFLLTQTAPAETDLLLLLQPTYAFTPHKAAYSS